MDYRADLLADLRESAEFAAEYLSAAYSDSRGAFLVALRDVVEARKGFAKVAAQAKVNRETLYRTLSKAGNPTLATLDSIWSVLGLEVKFAAKEAQSSIAPPSSAESTRIFVGPTFDSNTTIITAATTFDFGNLATLRTNEISVGHVGPNMNLDAELSGWRYAANLPIPNAATGEALAV